MLNAVQAVTKEQLLQFKAVPTTSEKLSIFAKDWIVNNSEELHFIETKKIIFLMS